MVLHVHMWTERSLSFYVFFPSFSLFTCVYVGQVLSFFLDLSFFSIYVHMMGHGVELQQASRGLVR